MLAASFRILVIVAVVSLVAACGSSPRYREAAPQGGGVYKVGQPYKVAGQWYYPKEDPNYDHTGIASWYGQDFHGRATANGERYDMNSLTAAHKTLPMPTYVRVTNLDNGRSLILRVNDRGPFVGDRIIDVSRRSAQLLGFETKGTTRVRVQAVAPDSPAATYVAKAKDEAIGPAVEAVPAEKVEVASLAEATETTPSAPIAEKLFIQAGAFSTYRNASRLADALKDLAKIELSSTTRGSERLYRVRLGPVSSISEANTLLSQVLARGQAAARIVVD